MNSEAREELLDEILVSLRNYISISHRRGYEPSTYEKKRISDIEIEVKKIKQEINNK